MSDNNTYDYNLECYECGKEIISQGINFEKAKQNNGVIGDYNRWFCCSECDLQHSLDNFDDGDIDGNY